GVARRDGGRLVADCAGLGGARRPRLALSAGERTFHRSGAAGLVAFSPRRGRSALASAGDPARALERAGISAQGRGLHGARRAEGTSPRRGARRGGGGVGRGRASARCGGGGTRGAAAGARAGTPARAPCAQDTGAVRATRLAPCSVRHYTTG